MMLANLGSGLRRMSLAASGGHDGGRVGGFPAHAVKLRLH